MSSVICWGAPGSYKTSRATEQYLVPAVQAGRLIVTNIRGFSVEKVLEHWGNPNNLVPSKVPIIHLPRLETEASLEMMRNFFRWCPKGALVAIDEVQLVFPTDLKVEKYKDQYVLNDFSKVILQDYSDVLWVKRNIEVIKKRFLADYGDEIDISEKTKKWVDYLEIVAGRPPDLRTALTMHRHHGWDFILTLPDINQLNKYVRGVCEGAYSHTNMAIYGFKGRYVSRYHAATDSDKNPKQVKMWQRIDKRTFKCYASTSTGNVSDTISSAGNPFLNPKLLILVFLLVVVLILPFFSSDLTGGKSILSGSSPPSKENKESKPISSSELKSEQSAKPSSSATTSPSKVNAVNSNAAASGQASGQPPKSNVGGSDSSGVSGLSVPVSSSPMDVQAHSPSISKTIPVLSSVEDFNAYLLNAWNDVMGFNLKSLVVTGYFISTGGSQNSKYFLSFRKDNVWNSFDYESLLSMGFSLQSEAYNGAMRFFVIYRDKKLMNLPFCRKCQEELVPDPSLESKPSGDSQKSEPVKTASSVHTYFIK